MSRPPRCRSGIGGFTSHTRSPFYVQPALHPLAGAFRFDKNGLHSVTAQGKFKMSLLLVLE